MDFHTTWQKDKRMGHGPRMNQSNFHLLFSYFFYLLLTEFMDLDERNLASERDIYKYVQISLNINKNPDEVDLKVMS